MKKTSSLTFYLKDTSINKIQDELNALEEGFDVWIKLAPSYTATAMFTLVQDGLTVSRK